MKLSTKKLFLISLIVGASLSSCKATSTNNNNQSFLQRIGYSNNNNNHNSDDDQQTDMASVMKYLIQSMEKTNEKTSQIQTQCRKDMMQFREESDKRFDRMEKRFDKKISEGSQEFKTEIRRERGNSARLEHKRVALEKKNRIKKQRRRKRRTTQRRDYIFEELNLRREKYLEAKAAQTKEAEAKKTTSTVLGVISAVAGVGVLMATGPVGIIIGGLTTLGCTGASIATGVDAKITAAKKVPDDRKEPEELLQRAREMYPSSSSEDGSS